MSQKFVITPRRRKIMAKVAKNGGTLEDVVKALGTTLSTFNKACKEAGLWSWRQELFPSRRGTQAGPRPGEREYRQQGGVVRRLKPEQAVASLAIPDTPQTQWLTKPWRKAA